jgi:cell wall-associated NlpC family hydrolase
MRRMLAAGVMLSVAGGLVALRPGSGPSGARAQEGAPRKEGSAYRSPYRVEFSLPLPELVGDLERTERGDRRIEAEVPHEEWYSRRVLERWGAWGPPARAYPPARLEGWTARRMRERVIAVAVRYLGYEYQHHHVPDWDPPAGWPWKPSCAGRNGRGVDCSNFTGFVYNLGFGLRLNTDVQRQAVERSAMGPGESRTPVRRVELPGSFGARIEALRTGDLLFIRNRGGEISHVVIWVGSVGRSPDGVPLVLDSHGEDTRDSEGHLIPCGIHLRPFRENSWYNRSASHALRVIPGE